MSPPPVRGQAAGLLLGAAIGGVLAFLTEEVARAAAANLLTLIAAIYLGFGLASGKPEKVLVQGLGAGAFFALAVLGLWLSTWWIVAGLVLHGLWDLGHHGREGAVREIPEAYPLFCAFFDWGLALGLVLRIGPLPAW
ncbi:DUF6010 family protein [Thiohalorhabdus sp.]|uniref:DUF6010 family protein n=1 Tax=Thiohalorhabdus sp. TaxID=3094134 RepID=UPI002FC27E87